MGFSRATERVMLFEQDYKCNMCKEKLQVHYHFDHIIRSSDGGTDDRSNGQVLCLSCHAAKTAGEQRVAPVGSVVLAARERQNTNNLKRKIDDMLSRDTQQQWGNERIERLLTWKYEDDLRPAAFQRTPVWPVKSQQEFILVLLNNQITAPLYIMKFSNTTVLELYDGINRMHAIDQFVKGELYIKIDGEVVYYKLPPGTSGREMTEDQRKLFLRRDMQVAWWSNLDECEACDMALKLNSGTAANISERLRWITGIATPRSQMLTRLSKTDVGIFFLELRDRTVLFSWMGEIIMRRVTGSWNDIIIRVAQYTQLEEFYRSKDEIKDSDSVFSYCHDMLEKVRNFVVAKFDGQEDARGATITQLQLLVRAFSINPNMKVTERSHRTWVEARRKRIYSSNDFSAALHTILDESLSSAADDDDED